MGNRLAKTEPEGPSDEAYNSSESAGSQAENESTPRPSPHDEEATAAAAVETSGNDDNKEDAGGEPPQPTDWKTRTIAASKTCWGRFAALVVVVGGVVAILAGVGVIPRTADPKWGGESCSKDSDCRSNYCADESDFAIYQEEGKCVCKPEAGGTDYCEPGLFCVGGEGSTLCENNNKKFDLLFANKVEDIYPGNCAHELDQSRECYNRDRDECQVLNLDKLVDLLHDGKAGQFMCHEWVGKFCTTQPDDCCERKIMQMVDCIGKDFISNDCNMEQCKYTPSKEGGEKCVSKNECLSGSCMDSACKCSVDTVDPVACIGDLFCNLQSGTCFDPRKKFGGDSCKRHNQCRSGECATSIDNPVCWCTKDDGTGNRIGNFCRDGQDCDGKWTCSEPTPASTPEPTRKPTRAPTVPPDPCTPNPCLNGGTCLPRSSSSGFICSCLPESTGSRCAKCSFLNTSPAQAKLLPNDGAAGDLFGRSVAIDGDTIVIGAFSDDENGSESGSAYVLTRESTGTAWRQQAKLLSDDGAAGDLFGTSVAIDGDTIVVGAYGDDDNGSYSGSAYVFTRESAGTAWRQQDKLLADDSAADDYFGVSVAIDGDTIVVGAHRDGNDNGSYSGSAYVFTRESAGTSWRQQDKLLPNDGAAGDLFGTSVAIDGDTIVIGARRDDDNGEDSGSAYVFTRESAGTAWRQQDKLLPDDGDANDYFGLSVAINGDTIVVGAFLDDTDNGSDSGSAYVFTRTSTGMAWRQQAKLLPNDGAADDRFGVSVAIDGVTIVVGAKQDDDKGSHSGSAYVFTRTSTGMAWRQQSKLLPNDGAADDRFGNRVAIDGDTIVVGADGDDGDDDNEEGSGSAYAFDFC